MRRTLQQTAVQQLIHRVHAGRQSRAGPHQLRCAAQSLITKTLLNAGNEGFDGHFFRLTQVQMWIISLE